MESVVYESKMLTFKKVCEKLDEIYGVRTNSSEQFSVKELCAYIEGIFENESEEVANEQDKVVSTGGVSHQ